MLIIPFAFSVFSVYALRFEKWTFSSTSQIHGHNTLFQFYPSILNIAIDRGGVEVASVLNPFAGSPESLRLFFDNKKWSGESRVCIEVSHHFHTIKYDEQKRRASKLFPVPCSSSPQSILERNVVFPFSSIKRQITRKLERSRRSRISPCSPPLPDYVHRKLVQRTRSTVRRKEWETKSHLENILISPTAFIVFFFLFFSLCELYRLGEVNSNERGKEKIGKEKCERNKNYIINVHSALLAFSKRMRKQNSRPCVTKLTNSCFSKILWNVIEWFSNTLCANRAAISPPWWIIYEPRRKQPDFHRFSLYTVVGEGKHFPRLIVVQTNKTENGKRKCTRFQQECLYFLEVTGNHAVTLLWHSVKRIGKEEQWKDFNETV